MPKYQNNGAHERYRKTVDYFDSRCDFNADRSPAKGSEIIVYHAGGKSSKDLYREQRQRAEALRHEFRL